MSKARGKLKSPMTPAELQIPIERLPSVYRALLQVLNESGLTGPPLETLLSAALRAKCRQCGVEVSAAEIGQLAASDAKTPIDNPKAERLRLGYCARNRCDSRFYVIHFAPTAGVDWAETFKRTEEILSAAPAEDSATRTPSGLWFRTRALWGQFQPRQRRQLMVLAGLGMLLLAIRWYQSGAWIPGLSPRPQEFIVESDEGTTQQAPRLPPLTNAEGSFIVK
ncbi:MAG: hypothetical protein HY735_33735 [Verrucomicrobia bacterium]|nr:hypothetical protein [Verrucomicrobiota bacterium]